jgi:hypothetical protein
MQRIGNIVAYSAIDRRASTTITEKSGGDEYPWARKMDIDAQRRGDCVALIRAGRCAFSLQTREYCGEHAHDGAKRAHDLFPQSRTQAIDAN